MTTDSGIVSGVSVSHQRATLDRIEQASAESQQSAVKELLAASAVSEAFVLQTCNRVEAYVVTDHSETGRGLLDEFVEGIPADAVREMDHETSLRHLLRVAAGLESLVLGEDQILGQVRDAYEDARAAGGIGPLLETGVTKAIRVGERARTETAINEGVVSLASAAVKLAAEKHGLADATATVIGAGEMGTLAAKRLAPQVPALVLANRTVSRAESLADTVEPTDASVRATGLDEVGELVEHTDILISATGSSEYVLGEDELASAGQTFVVDITRPRDVPPAAAEMDGLTVYDLDRLEAVTRKTRKRRQAAASRVEGIVEKEFDRLLVQYKREQADEVISAMYEGAERIKARELGETFSALDLDDEQEAVIEAMADSIVSQLLAAPTNSLRDAAQEDDWSTIHTALQLFDPALDAPVAPGDMGDDVSLDDVPEHVRDEIPPAIRERLEE